MQLDEEQWLGFTYVGCLCVSYWLHNIILIELLETLFFSWCFFCALLDEHVEEMISEQYVDMMNGLV